jgi:hypothetical protein
VSAMTYQMKAMVTLTGSTTSRRPVMCVGDEGWEERVCERESQTSLDWTDDGAVWVSFRTISLQDDVPRTVNDPSMGIMTKFTQS